MFPHLSRYVCFLLRPVVVASRCHSSVHRQPDGAPQLTGSARPIHFRHGPRTTDLEELAVQFLVRFDVPHEHRPLTSVPKRRLVAMATILAVTVAMVVTDLSPRPPSHLGEIWWWSRRV